MSSGPGMGTGPGPGTGLKEGPGTGMGGDDWQKQARLQMTPPPERDRRGA